MTGNLMQCDDDQLLAMLRTEGDITEPQLVFEHVEGCSRCQSRLLELAADDGDWQNVAVALSATNDVDRAMDLELTQSVLHRNSHRADRSVEWNESMVRQLLDPPAHPEMLGRLGRYQIECLIGSGGAGIVFKAYDTELHRPVAIKILAPYLASSGSARQRFAREARSAAGIVDDHVVPIHNVESEHQPPFLVMQYVAGGSLQEKLDRNGPLDVVEILRIGVQTAKGLAAAHAQGLIHRDVKPSNILLDEGVERALLTDFGLARAQDDARLTCSGFHPGTPHYMSPEQVRGETLDGRSDLFSLGCVLYALCTGRPPFRADSGYAVLRRITDDAPRSIREVNPDIPEWLEHIVMKLLAKDCRQRFQSADEVADMLSAWLAHLQQPNAVPAPTPLRTVDRDSSRNRHRWTKYLLTAAAGLLLLWAGIVIVLETGKGTIRIECDVDQVPIRILKGDDVVESLVVSKPGRGIRVAAGEYVVEIDAEPDSLKVERDGSVTVARGKEQLVRIVKEPGPSTEPQQDHSVSEVASQSGGAMEGRWRRESTTVAGSGTRFDQKFEDFAIFGQRTVRVYAEGRKEHADIYAYVLRPNGVIVFQGFRDGRLNDITLGKVQFENDRLYLALNMRPVPDRSTSPMRARSESPETTEHDVLYFVYVRESWTETDRNESLDLDKRIQSLTSYEGHQSDITSGSDAYCLQWEASGKVRLRPGFAETLHLQAREQTAVNALLTEIWNEYVAAEHDRTVYSRADDGHLIAEIGDLANERNGLANKLWSKLGKTVSDSQREQIYRSLKSRSDRAFDEIWKSASDAYPGLLGWSKDNSPVHVEIHTLNDRFHWYVRPGRHGVTGDGAGLPFELEHYFKNGNEQLELDDRVARSSQAGKVVGDSSAATNHTCDVGGREDESGMISGKLAGFPDDDREIRYSIALTAHVTPTEQTQESHANEFGPRSPAVVVSAGESFAFTNVPPGRYTVQATAIIQARKQIVGKAVSIDLEATAGKECIVGVAFNSLEDTSCWVEAIRPMTKDQRPPRVDEKLLELQVDYDQLANLFRLNSVELFAPGEFQTEGLIREVAEETLVFTLEARVPLTGVQIHRLFHNAPQHVRFVAENSQQASEQSVEVTDEFPLICDYRWRLPNPPGPDLPVGATLKVWAHIGTPGRPGSEGVIAKNPTRVMIEMKESSQHADQNGTKPHSDSSDEPVISGKRDNSRKERFPVTDVSKSPLLMWAHITDHDPVILPDNRLLTGTKIRDMNTGEEIGRFDFGGEKVLIAKLSSNGRYLLVCSEVPQPPSVLLDYVPTKIQVWDMATLKPAGEAIDPLPWPFHLQEMQSRVDVSSDGTTVVMVLSEQLAKGYGANGETGGIHSWNMQTGKHSFTNWLYPGIGNEVDAVALSPDGQWLVISDNNRLGYWKRNTGDEPIVIPVGRRIISLAFSPDGRYVAEGPDSQHDIQVRDMRTMEVTRSFRNAEQLPLYVSRGGLKFSADGRRLIAGNAIAVDERKLDIPYRLHVWDFESAEVLKQIDTRYQVWSVSVTPDGDRIVARLVDADQSVVAMWQLHDDAADSVKRSDTDASSQNTSGDPALQGEWEYVSYEENGKVSGYTIRSILSISGDVWALQPLLSPELSHRVVIRGQDVTFFMNSEPGAPTGMPYGDSFVAFGRFQLAGDTLTYCMTPFETEASHVAAGTKHPQNFGTAGTKNIVYRLKRNSSETRQPGESDDRTATNALKNRTSNNLDRNTGVPLETVQEYAKANGISLGEAKNRLLDELRGRTPSGKESVEQPNHASSDDTVALLQGEWEYMTVSEYGKVRKLGNPMALVISEGNWNYYHTDSTLPFTFQVEVSGKNFKMLEPPLVIDSVTRLGRLEVTNDQLTYCIRYDNRQPENLDETDPGNIVCRLRRKPSQAAQNDPSSSTSGEATNADAVR